MDACRQDGPWVSVVVNNFNYGAYLAQAIDSATTQTYDRTEVVVVDDGSTDDSRRILAGYRGRVRTVLQDNGGQGSAFNAGFRSSRGDIVIFLDADDALLPHAVESVVSRFAAGVVKAHWPLWIVDDEGRRKGPAHPAGRLPGGDLRELVLRQGPTTQLAPPTSGNAWSRAFLEQVLPVPEDLYTISADKYLLETAPFFGRIAAIADPLSLYRVHDRNSQRVGVAERLARELRLYEHYAGFLRRYCEACGQAVDLGVWRRNSWWHRQEQALREIATLPADAGPLLLVDLGAWGPGPIAGRARWPGPEWSSPADEASAVAELERMRQAGAALLVFVWSTFWWLEHYSGLRRHLRCAYPCVLQSEQVIAFDLRSRS